MAADVRPPIAEFLSACLRERPVFAAVPRPALVERRPPEDADPRSVPEVASASSKHTIISVM